MHNIELCTHHAFPICACPFSTHTMLILYAYTHYAPICIHPLCAHTVLFLSMHTCTENIPFCSWMYTPTLCTHHDHPICIYPLCIPTMLFLSVDTQSMHKQCRFYRHTYSVCTICFSLCTHPPCAQTIEIYIVTPTLCTNHENSIYIHPPSIYTMLVLSVHTHSAYTLGFSYRYINSVHTPCCPYTYIPMTAINS